MFICIPTSVGNVFGLKYGTTVYSCVLLGSMISSILNVLNAKFILINFGFGTSYFICFLATFAAGVILYNFEEKLDVDRVFKKDQIKEN